MSITPFTDGFATVAEAVAVANTSGPAGVAFLALSGTNQEYALKRTAAGIDALDYVGELVSDDQAMSFPRTGARGDAIRRITRANIEFAMAAAAKFATDATDDALNTESADDADVQSVKIGPIEEKKFASALQLPGSLKGFPPVVRTLLDPLLAKNATVVARNWGQGSARRVS